MFADSLEDKLQKQPAGEDDKIDKEDSQNGKVGYLFGSGENFSFFATLLQLMV
jgi:hypothetical protein